MHGYTSLAQTYADKARYALLRRHTGRRAHDLRLKVLGRDFIREVAAEAREEMRLERFERTLSEIHEEEVAERQILARIDAVEEAHAFWLKQHVAPAAAPKRPFAEEPAMALKSDERPRRKENVWLWALLGLYMGMQLFPRPRPAA